jgi:hypothetical protein
VNLKRRKEADHLKSHFTLSTNTNRLKMAMIIQDMLGIGMESLVMLIIVLGKMMKLLLIL